MTRTPKSPRPRDLLDYAPPNAAGSNYPRDTRFRVGSTLTIRVRRRLCGPLVGAAALAIAVVGCAAPSSPPATPPPATPSPASSATPISQATATSQATPTDQAAATPAPTQVAGSMLSAGVPALSTGTIEEAQKAVGLTARLPSYLPEGAEREGPARYFVRDGQGMVSIAYRVGLHGVAIEYLKLPVDQMPELEGQPVAVGGFQAVAHTQPREPSDPLPPETQVTWRDGDVTVRVRGDLLTSELIKVAESLYQK